jgi:AcrR family transcriptional regulator
MEKEVKPTRRYDSTRRQETARETRRAILDATRDLFMGRGYAATTMPAIAGAAGVNVDTIYAAIGRKPDLVRLLLESALSGEDGPVPALERAYVQEMRAEPDARRKLARYARAVCEIQQRLVPLLRILRDAATGEPSLASLWTEISARRAANMRLLIADLAATGEMREGLSHEQAADVIWATNSPEFYGLLVEERGWTPGQLESWLADAWARLLLADPVPPGEKLSG